MVAEAAVTQETQGTRLRVCVVLPSATRGGAEIWQERLAAAGSRVDLEVVALAEGDAAAQWRRLGVPVTVVATGTRAKGAPRTVAQVAARLRRSRPDLVLGHGVKAGLVAAAAGAMSGTRSAWVRHDDSFEGGLVRLLDTLVDGRVSSAQRLTNGRPAGLVVPPPLPTGTVGRAEATARLGLADDGLLRVAMATRLAPYKGVDDAIRALAQVDGWALHVYGVADAAYPGERGRLVALAESLGVAGRVHLHDPVDGIGSLLAAHDALAVLTRADRDARVTGESHSMAAHEALACGVPVVATPPLEQTLGEGCLAVPAGDPAAVAAALVGLTDGAVRARVAAAGQDVVAGEDPKAAADSLERHLAAVALRPGAGRVGGPPVSVITTVLGEAEGLGTLLRQLRPQLGPDDEVVVVDGGSRDATVDVARAHAQEDPRVTVVVSPGAGISAGRNIGIERARHDLVACTDVGCEPAKGWLSSLRRAAADHPGALLTGVYDVTATTPLQRALAVTGYPVVEESTHPTPLTRLHGRLFGRAFDPTMPTGRSMALHRDAWREVGGFPEHLATGEDVTFGRAVAQRRPAVLVTDALVTWEQRPTLRSTLRMYYRYGQGSGHSRDALLLARDAVRALAYPAGVVLVARGGAARGLALAAGALYLSVPALRAARGPQPVRTALLVAPVSALRDGAKVLGAVDGLRHPPDGDA